MSDSRMAARSDEGPALLAQWSIQLPQQHEGRIQPGRELPFEQQGVAWQWSRRFLIISPLVACTVIALTYGILHFFTECPPSNGGLGGCKNDVFMMPLMGVIPRSGHQGGR